MNALLKNFLLILLILITISALFSFFFQPLEEIKEVSITQAIDDIKQDKVDKIIVSGNEIEIIYRDGSKAKSIKDPASSFSELLINYGVEKEELSVLDIDFKESNGGWSWLVPVLFSILPVLIFGLFFWMIFRQARTGAMQTFDFTKSKARLFGAGGFPKEKINFNDVAGLKEAKEELKEVVDFLRNPKKFLRMGARIPRGILLLGPSGVGKTLLARAVAGEANVPFFHTSGSTFVELFVGTGAARVRDLFTNAKKNAPCLIFVDELDAVGRMRGAGIGGGHDEREQTLNQLLVEMDGFERDTNIIVLAATNRPDILDAALLRPGRFDRRVVLNLPDINDREAVLKIHCKGKPLALDVDLREIAERTPGFSGADLANVVNEAAILAARKNKNQVFQKEFLESIEKVLLGPERRSHILSKKEKEMAAFHEAGHALVSSLLSEAEPVRKISIIARGFAAGYTLKVPKEERKIKTKSEFLAEMATLLGGYCAEKIKFGQITTGASDDLKKASDLARKLVKRYGMSKLGPISFGEKEELVFLGREISEARNYSEKIASKIDREVERFIKSSEAEAKKILLKNKKLLDKVAKTLIEKEIIERKEFEELIGKRKRETKTIKVSKVKPEQKSKKRKSIKVQVKKL
jgi:cell division protease FtsH